MLFFQNRENLGLSDGIQVRVFSLQPELLQDNRVQKNFDGQVEQRRQVYSAACIWVFSPLRETSRNIWTSHHHG